MPDTLKAITFDQAKAKLNLGEAHLYAGMPFADFGLRDFDKAHGRTLRGDEARMLVRIRIA